MAKGGSRVVAKKGQRVQVRTEIPSEQAIEAERQRLEYQSKYRRTLRSTVFALVVVAAISVLLASLFLPVLQVYGDTMEPTLSDGDLILLLNSGEYEQGDLVGFYYQNKLLLKRVIGTSGDVIDIDEEGNVTVNGQLLDEPYLTSRAFGESDLTYPYTVPDGKYFVLGDNRADSIDSRSSVVGCIESDQIVGRIVMRVWPFEKIGFVG